METSVRNIIGACQQLVNGDEGFSNLYNNYKDDKGNHRVLKATCCGADASSIYVAGKDFTAQTLTTFGNGKAFSRRTIWAMADSVSLSLKKALSLVYTLSPKLVLINSTYRVVGYASGKNEALFMQAINHGMYLMDTNKKSGISLDDDKKLGTLKETLTEKSNVETNVESLDGDDNIDDSVTSCDSVDVDLNNKPSEDNLACNGYSYTGKLDSICFGPTTGQFYSPILSTGGSTNKSLEEKRRAVVQALKEHKRRKQPMSKLPVIREGSRNKIECNLV
jgi:hypothetical protein